MKFKWLRHKLALNTPRLTAISTAVIAVATIAYMIVSIFLWLATKESIKQSEKSFIREARPYVQIEKLEFKGDLSTGKFKGRTNIKNSGKTPAVNIRGCGDIILHSLNDLIRDDFPCPNPNNPVGETSETISVFALGPESSYATISSPGTTITPTTTLLDLLSSSNIHLFYYGELEYSDTIDSKTIYHTTFCARYNIDTNDFSFCEKHNNMD